jgi:hypothetical protein
MKEQEAKAYVKGVQEVKARVSYACANHFHSDPVIDVICNIENDYCLDLVESIVYDIIEELVTRSIENDNMAKA